MNRLDNFSKYKQFRARFDFFSFDSYSWKISGNQLEIEYFFNLAGHYFFNPKIRIPYKSNYFRQVDTLSPVVMDTLVFHTGMIELVSYWKAACPKKVIIKPHSLTDLHVDFWKKLYYHGLGEFFYLNSITTDDADFMEIQSHGSAFDPIRPESSDGILVPVGGGKDSAVTMGLLNNSKMDWLPLVINPGKTTRNVIAAARKQENEIVEIYREIHPQLLKLNDEGFLNGHTPFSAALAFYSLLSAYLAGRTDIVLSNESSANEATVPGTSINHQYSKSLEFEKDFREYVSRFISREFNYFSLMRPVSEIQIARIFSSMTEYHPHFRSCNAGSRTDSWCCRCPKCLFTYIILSPFIKPEGLMKIFGKNLLDEPELENYFEQLTGMQEVKPFECIGTVDEVNLALHLASRMYDPGDLPYLLRKFRDSSLDRPISELNIDALMKNTGTGHFVPSGYFDLLNKAIQ